MSRQRIWQLVKSDYVKLVPVLALAFYIAYIPHQNYPYPIHVDEWYHLWRFNRLIATSNVETGLAPCFSLLWVTFHQISGISWMDVFRYCPGIISVITTLSVYILARKKGFGWEAAFFTTLIPTTVGILGPAFLVPVSLGFVFIPLTLFLAFNYSTIRSYLVILIISCCLLSIHATSAICLIIILAPYIILNIKSNFRHSAGLTLALLLPFASLVIFPRISSLFIPTAEGLLTQQSLVQYILLPPIIQTYGYIPIGLCLLGTLILTVKGGKRNYGLVLGLLALLLMLVTFYTFHYGVAQVYHRGLQYMMLMVGIVAGAGLMAVKNINLPEKLRVWKSFEVPSIILRGIGIFLCLVLIGLTLFIAIPERQGTGYYYMIDEEDYEAFIWIRDNVDDEYKTAIVDPWKATAFSALTGKYVYTRIHEAPYAKDEKAYAFIKNGSTDTTFMHENGISIIYTRVLDAVRNTSYPSKNPHLVEIANNIYLLETGD